MDGIDLLTGLPGFRDFYPEYWKEIAFVLNKMRLVSQNYGYEEYEGPSLELVALIEAKSGEALIKEIFQLQDRSKRRLLLRPEQTPTLARMLAKEQQRYKRPIRWFSIPRLFRDETIQKGREREFWQLNVDILGEHDIAADAETIAVGIDIVRECGLQDQQFQVLINHKDLLNQFILSLGITNPDEIIALVDKKMLFIQESVRHKLRSSGMMENESKDTALLYRRLINSTGSFNKELLKKAPKEIVNLLDKKEIIFKDIMIKKFLENDLELKAAQKLFDLIKISGSPEEFLMEINKLDIPDACVKSVKELETLSKILKVFGVSGPVIFDASMARGLDYYTGIVYEAFDSTGEVVRSIFGGGRYANLVEAIGGSPLSGVGFGMGETVLLELMKLNNTIPQTIEEYPELYLAPIKADPIPRLIELSTRLRKSFRVICNPFDWRLKRHFEIADNLNANLVLLLGKRDLENNQISVRIVKSGENIQIPLNDNLEKEIQNILSNH